MPPSRSSKKLPSFVEPMLASLVEPFESDRHLFEIKWDGFRSLCFVEASGYRLVGRRKTDFTARFPELNGLSKLPKGTLLDGEIVHLTNGKPDFAALLGRERSWNASARASAPGNAAQAGARRFPPVTFVAFDLLYEKYKPILGQPLSERRDRLDALLRKRLGPRLALSEGTVGHGLSLFEHVGQIGWEGVVAKRLDGPYEPGRRGGSWLKFKRRQSVVCAIIGYEPSSARGLKSLLVATEIEGVIRFIGQVGGGISDADRRRLLSLFEKLGTKTPAIPCRLSAARWLKPELFCQVSFMEWTKDQKLRMPIFEKLL